MSPRSHYSAFFLLVLGIILPVTARGCWLLFLVLIGGIAIPGCTSLCGPGGSMRDVLCDRQSRGNADLQAQSEAQRANEAEQEQQQEAAKQAAAEAQIAQFNAQQNWHHKLSGAYGMPFCGPSDLFKAVYTPSRPIKQDCIYETQQVAFRVLQVIGDGVVATAGPVELSPTGKTIFIKTSRPYVDQDTVVGYFKYIGIRSYYGVLGQTITVHTFQELKALKPQ